MQWLIGTDGTRNSKESMLSERLDNDDDDDPTIILSTKFWRLEGIPGVVQVPNIFGFLS